MEKWSTKNSIYNSIKYEIRRDKSSESNEYLCTENYKIFLWKTEDCLNKLKDIEFS